MPTKPDIKTRYSPQELQNRSFDEDYGTFVSQGLGFDGVGVSRQNADAMAIKMTVVGNITYIGFAATGTAQSSALWQCRKIDTSVAGTTLITWADGDANFDNVATDLTTLTYS